MRGIIIALVALIVLAGGAGGAYFYFMQPAEASIGDEHEDTEHAKKEKKGDGHGGGHGEAMGEFVELDPLILPIVDDEGVSQVVSMVITIEVLDEDGKHAVEKMEPKLKDAYIQDMYGVLNRHAALKGGVIQVNAIKKRLNKLTAHILGEDVAQDVLLQVVQQRPI